MNLNRIFISILTLFIVGIIGYCSRKKNILSEEAVNSLPKFLLNICSPLLIVSSMQIPFTQDKLDDIKTVFLLSIIVYFISIIISLIVPKLLRANGDNERGVYQFMTIFSNVSFIGFPVLLSIYSSEAIFYGSIFIIPFNILLYTVGIYMMASEKKKFNIKILLNPNILAVIIGFLLFAFSIQIPAFLLQPMELVGNMTTPLSMIFIGGSLCGVNMKEMFKEWRLYAISAIRLLILPLIVLLLFQNFISDPLLLGVPVVITGMPIAANCAIVAKEYGGHAELASSGTFMSTLLSMVTIPLLVLIISNI